MSETFDESSVVMQDLLMTVIAIVLGIAVVAAAGYFAFASWRRKHRRPEIAGFIGAHLHPTPIDRVMISERRFPYRVRADLQRALDRLFADRAAVCRFCGVRQEYSHEGLSLTGCLVPSRHNPAVPIPPEYEEIDVGDEQPVRTLKNGLWFMRHKPHNYLVMLSPLSRFEESPGMRIQVATANEPDGLRIADEVFRELETAVAKAESYRGKILSLDWNDHSYSGKSTGINVHKLRTVRREQVILPQTTLDLLDRNVIQFVRQRPGLARFGQATKKGILFYGPPGTGKTHTIHYLAKALPGHTTLLITAGQIRLLGEYMTLARLLQPTIVVIEDADLIARDREELDGCRESLLNKLLNEMDGLREEADILFILTTNRPETLEAALASRPGRVDQAIEFPLPDDEGREKLVRLYSSGVAVPAEVVESIVRRTERVSGAFIKELMRRSVQFHLERDGAGALTESDIGSALDEMLFSGGSLNLKLLGAVATELD